MPINTIQGLRKGDTVLIRCVVKHDVELGEETLFTVAPNGYADVALMAEQIESTQQTVEIGDKVYEKENGVSGTVLAVNRDWVVIEQRIPYQPHISRIENVIRIDDDQAEKAA